MACVAQANHRLCGAGGMYLGSVRPQNTPVGRYVPHGVGPGEIPRA
jgi:hypothetical protein